MIGPNMAVVLAVSVLQQLGPPLGLFNNASKCECLPISDGKMLKSPALYNSQFNLGSILPYLTGAICYPFLPSMLQAGFWFFLSQVRTSTGKLPSQMEP